MTTSMSAPLADPLRHHGDTEAVGMADFAVNVVSLPRPTWLDAALRASLDDLGTYPDPTPAQDALAEYHGRDRSDVLVTAGAAEAFTLIARARRWRRPVVVHPQFTEPHAALEQAGHRVTHVPTRAEDGYRLDPAAVPADADLVVVGNPTNPTGVLHPRASILALRAPGRVVVVDEAFMDTVPSEPESLTELGTAGVVVLRSLTKHWAIPGVRAGYLLGEAELVTALRRQQTPWSVSATAIAAVRACASGRARTESGRRAAMIADWRDLLTTGLAALGIDHVPSSTSFVLARPGGGVHRALRERGIAVRRADTFPGLGPEHVRIAVRPEPMTTRLLDTLTEVVR